MEWWGIDVGGANLKWVDPAGRAASRAFPLWRQPEGLARELGDVLSGIGPGFGLAVTMTGELCDCFATKADGVRHIVSALQSAAGGARLAIYGVDGEFHSPHRAEEQPPLVAASNWHALATFASRWLPDGTGLLIDIGSTTSDLIPVKGGRVATSSQTDTQRLMAGELVYSGIGRTPLMALVANLPYRGADCPVAAELFATTADAYFLLDRLQGAGEGTDWTADRRELTRPLAIDRLARSICADRTTFNAQDALAAAKRVEQSQLDQLGASLRKVMSNFPGENGDFVVAGSGDWLARQLLAGRPGVRGIVSLSDRLGLQGSQGATAVAVATLARERM